MTKRDPMIASPDPPALIPVLCDVSQERQVTEERDDQARVDKGTLVGGLDLPRRRIGDE